MNIILRQKSLNLERPNYSIINESGVIFSVKSRFLNFLEEKLDVIDEYNTMVACITQSLLSITPKFKISIRQGNSFILSQKLSIYPKYKIRGSSYEIKGNVNKNFIINKDGKQTAQINIQINSICSEYILETQGNDDEVIECICIVLAVDLAKKRVSRLQSRS